MWKLPEQTSRIRRPPPGHKKMIDFLKCEEVRAGLESRELDWIKMELARGHVESCVKCQEHYKVEE